MMRIPGRGEQQSGERAVQSAPATIGLILAGGLARRMGGGDKPLQRLGGRTLLERVVERLAPQCGGLLLSANGDPARFAGFGIQVIADSIPDHPGPLAGILAGLDHAAERAARPNPDPHPEAPRSGLEGGFQKAQRPMEGSFEARLRRAPQDEGEDGMSETARVPSLLSVSGDAPFLPPDLVKRLQASQGGAGRPAFAASGGRDHYTVALWPLSLRGALRQALERGERRVGGFLAAHRAVTVEWPVEPVDPFLNVNTPDDLAQAQALLDRLG